ncbi:DUF4870 domain-containing protein [Microbacterium sp. NPDC096154]|uniref:DUF4870 domain-containing protein n=1 Tax=Microbacterium sp. NPDC096154 TaxID=3155549 RepID=UPI00332C9832
MTYPYPQQPYAGAPQPMNPSDEKMWATLTHIGGIFFSFLAPLIAYLVMRDRGPFVRAHTAAALNFQLTLLIAYFAGGILSVILIGIPILLAAGVIAIVFPIIAAVKASGGIWYRYPSFLAIPFVS